VALILADTDVLIDFCASKEPISSVVKELLSSNRLLLSAITSFELLTGATDGKRGDKVRELVDDLEVLPLDKEASFVAARVRRELESQGQGIGVADSLIAGIAIKNDLTLFTQNRKHFNRVKDLRMFNPSARA